jgi:hypothetical protein
MILIGANAATDGSKAVTKIADDAQPPARRTQRFYSVKMRRGNPGFPQASSYELDCGHRRPHWCKRALSGDVASILKLKL